MTIRLSITVAVALAMMLGGASSGGAATLNYVGSQANLDDGLFPGGGLPYVTAYWRSDTPNNVYAVSSASPNRYYGTAGYAMFATTFTYPNANELGGEGALDPNVPDPLYPNISDLPSWVADSQILATRMAGGFAYALVDDPRLQHGIRHWTFDGVNYPDAGSGAPNTGQNPYVKIGFLDGSDNLGNNPVEEPTGRWGFTVGADVPAAFRVGVMTSGNDNANFAPQQVFLQQFNGATPVGAPLGTGILTGTLKDRFVDMHFFDIIGAQEGDSFVFGAMAGPGSFGNSGIAAFSFDVLTTIPVANGDFDDNGVVDGADFLLWQRNFGVSGQGDGNNDGVVDGADLQIWTAQFGSSAAAGAAGVVPEPAAATLLAIALLAAVRFRK
jgi:hypothetical protein